MNHAQKMEIAELQRRSAVQDAALNDEIMLHASLLETRMDLQSSQFEFNDLLKQSEVLKNQVAQLRESRNEIQAGLERDLGEQRVTDDLSHKDVAVMPAMVRKAQGTMGAFQQPMDIDRHNVQKLAGATQKIQTPAENSVLEDNGGNFEGMSRLQLSENILEVGAEQDVSHEFPTQQRDVKESETLDDSVSRT